MLKLRAFWNSGVTAKFINGDVLLIVLLEVQAYALEEQAAVAFAAACDELDVFGVDAYSFWVHTWLGLGVSFNLMCKLK